MSPAFDPDSVTRAMASARWSALVRTGLDAASLGLWDPGLCARAACWFRSTCRRCTCRRVRPSRGPRCRWRSRRPTARTRPSRRRFSRTARRAPRACTCTGRRPTRCFAERSPTSGDDEPPPDCRRCPIAGSSCACSCRGAPTCRTCAAGSSRPTAPGRSRSRPGLPARPMSPPAGRTVPAAELTGSAGGSLNWVGIYDATVNRLAFHDPLDDLAAVAPGGVEGDQTAYVVAGWWSTAALDPLDGAQTTSSLHDPPRRARLGARRRPGGRRPHRPLADGRAAEARESRTPQQRALRTGGAASAAEQRRDRSGARPQRRRDVQAGHVRVRRRDRVRRRVRARVAALGAAARRHLRRPAGRGNEGRQPSDAVRRWESRSASTATTSPRRWRRPAWPPPTPRSAAASSACSRPSPATCSTASAQPMGSSTSKSTSTPQASSPARAVRAAPTVCRAGARRPDRGAGRTARADAARCPGRRRRRRGADRSLRLPNAASSGC